MRPAPIPRFLLLMLLLAPASVSAESRIVAFELGLRGGPALPIVPLLEDTVNDRPAVPATLSISITGEPALAFDKQLSALLSIGYTGRLETWPSPDEALYQDLVFNTSIIRVMVGVRYRLTWTRVLPYLSGGFGAGVMAIETTYGPSEYGTRRLAGANLFGAVGMEAYPSGNKVAFVIEARGNLWAGEQVRTDIPGDGGTPYGLAAGPVEGMFELTFGIMVRS